MDKYNLLEKAVEVHDWNKILEIIDIESLAKHHIVYEVTWNADAYKSSFFMYMNGKNDKIHFGPIWDFDRTYNNDVNNKVPNIIIKVPSEVKNGRYDKYSEMMFELVHFPEFKNVMKTEWNKYMKNGLNDILDRQKLWQTKECSNATSISSATSCWQNALLLRSMATTATALRHWCSVRCRCALTSLAESHTLSLA